MHIKNIKEIDNIAKKINFSKLAYTREQLLKYCELDTYAMVKIWENFIKKGEIFSKQKMLFFYFVNFMS